MAWVAVRGAAPATAVSTLVERPPTCVAVSPASSVLDRLPILVESMVLSWPALKAPTWVALSSPSTVASSAPACVVVSPEKAVVERPWTWVVLRPSSVPALALATW